MGRLRDKFMTIGFLSSLSVFVVAMASLAFIFIFAVQFAELQGDLIFSEFEKLVLINVDKIDSTLVKAHHNIERIMANMSILDMADRETALNFLKKSIAVTIQFEDNQYDGYFAFEKKLARKYFGQEGYILNINKNFRDYGTPRYGKPENSRADVWTDPQYMTNQKEVWYHAAKRSQGFENSPIYFDENYMKVWMFTVAKGIYRDGRFEGMVGIDILLDSLLSGVENANVGQSGGLCIIDNRTGLVITKADRKRELGFIENRERFQVNLYNTRKDKETWWPVLNSNSNDLTLKGVDGKDYFISATRLSTLPWTIIAFHSKDEMMSALYSKLGGFALMGAILLLFSLGVIRLSARNLAQPIQQLVDAMKQVKDADVTGVSAPVGGTVETKALGEIFNSMIHKIADAVKEKEIYYSQVEEMNVTLEHRVEERTCQLKQKNVELEDTLEKLKETQEQLVVKEKLASLGALTAGIAHEIKNPLNFVNNFAFLSVDLVDELREKMESQKDRLDPGVVEESREIMEDLRTNVTKINEHGKRADNIVKNMLLHSRGKRGDFQDTDLNSLLEEYVNLAYHGQRAADASFNITIDKTLDPSVGKLPLVPQDLGRVILNIANNGFYAASEKQKKSGGGFTPQFSYESRNLGDSVEMRFKDNGTGIPAAIKDRIFNPFFTTKPPGANTGLGLSMSFDIVVQEHKGEIRVETVEGEYTQFIVTIPRNLKKA